MQVSNHGLPREKEARLLEQLDTVLADLHSPKETTAFLSSFLTPTERLVFAKRLAIAWLLEQGKSYGEISKQLKVSSATISSVAELSQSQGMQLALRRMELDVWTKNLQQFFFFWKKRKQV